MVVLLCALRIPEVQRPTGPGDPRGQNSFHNNSKRYFHDQLCSECTQEFSRDRICDIRTLMTNRISHYDCVCLYFYIFLVLFSRSLWLRRGLEVACCMVRITECSSACMGPVEGGAIIFITSTIVWPQVKQQGGNTAPPINSKLD